MKKILPAIFFFVVIHQSKVSAQTLYTGYASCGAANGYFNVDPGGIGCTFLWSTGATTGYVTVPPGNYTVTVTDTTNGSSSTLQATMWADTWQLHINPSIPGWVMLRADLAGCRSLIYTAPSCNPFPDDGAYGIIWEDSIPIDTVYNVSCDVWSQSWVGVQPGHCYNFSIFEPSCGCFQATWMYSPSRRYCEPLTNGVREEKNDRIKLIPSIVHSEAKFETANWRTNQSIDLKIFNSIGSVIHSDKISNLSSYILQRNDLLDGLYFYELRTLNYELIASGKFIVE